ncbi:putative ricin B-like lectin [Helianthus debilis subsp. tardiflorus]
MDKCSGGENYLTVSKHGKVSLQSLTSVESLAFADWKSIAPPKRLNHREFRFWVSRGTGKCLTVFGGNSKKRMVGVADCKFDGANKGQLFAFRFHYHNSFCCCGHHNK